MRRFQHGHLHKNFKPNEYLVRDDHAVILLRQKRGPVLETMIDIDDLDRVLGHSGSWATSKPGGRVYASSHEARPSRKLVYLHRFITNAPAELVVDHINHDTLDNRKANLRVTTQQVNMLNHQDCGFGVSGARGVYYDERCGRWVAKFRHRARSRWLGEYLVKNDAIRVLQSAVAIAIEEATGNLPPDEADNQIDVLCQNSGLAGALRRCGFTPTGSSTKSKWQWSDGNLYDFRTAKRMAKEILEKT